MDSKQQLGQFYTKNSDYILQGLISVIPEDATVIDPFAGEGDILKFVKKRRPNCCLMGHDIDPKYDGCEYRDSLLNPYDYRGKWVATNPPYLARNKTSDKEVFDMYKTDDLYKASLKAISGFVKHGCEGGFVVVPLNFFSDRDNKMRRYFFSQYDIVRLNIFEEQVFVDTSYTVCSFSFVKKVKNDGVVGEDRQRCKSVWIHPDKIRRDFTLSYSNGYMMGSDFIKHCRRNKCVKISRLVESIDTGDLYTTKLFLRAIDTGSTEGRISLSLTDDLYFGKISDRTFATLLCNIVLTTQQENQVIEKFNSILELYREKYHSLFLTNFRNSTSAYARKRIDFKSAFGLVENCIYEVIGK